MGYFCPPGSGYGSMDPIQSGSNPDLDPHHCPLSFLFPVFGFGSIQCCTVADSFYVDADLYQDPSFYFDANPRIRMFILALIWIRILFLVNMMCICDHWFTGPPASAPFWASTNQGWKKPGFKKKPSPVGFFGFFWVFWVFGFFGVFLPRREGFRGFFSFKNTFRCIQTLNYNHSY